MLEKTRKTEKVKKVDMQWVNKLLQFQRKRNEELESTAHYCSLYPRTSEPCISCQFRKQCKHYGWERDYIHKHTDAAGDAQRRKMQKEAKWLSG